MEVRTRGDYELAEREVVASEITDAFVCLEGPMVVETRAPRNDYLLTPGQRCAVPPRTCTMCMAHRMDRARF